MSRLISAARPATSFDTKARWWQATSTESSAARCELTQSASIALGIEERLGAGVVTAADAVVAGTSAPLCRVTDVPIRDPKGRLWTDPHVTSDRWLLEANLGEMGTQHEWLKALVVGRGATFEDYERTAKSAQLGCRGASAHLGPRAMDLRALNTGRPAGLLMPFGETSGSGAVGASEVLRSYLESCAYAARAGLVWLDAIAEASGPLTLTGGMSRSRWFGDMLASVLKRGVVRADAESTARGAAMCAAVGTGSYARSKRRHKKWPGLRLPTSRTKTTRKTTTTRMRYGWSARPISRSCERMIYESERAEVCEYAIRMWKAGLVVGSAGNISVRTSHPDHFVITPSSIAYEELTPDQVVVVDEEGDLLDEDVLGDDEELDRAPSFECPIHLGVYAVRKDVNAVVHTHSRYATIQAVLRRAIPPVIDEMVVYLGGAVECAEYGMSGSDELADRVVSALGPRSAVLLASHGVLTTGKDLKKAFKNAELVEHLAHVIVTATQLGGELSPLPDDVLAAELQMYDIVKSM